MDVHSQAFEYADQVVESNAQPWTVLVGAEFDDKHQIFAHYAKSLSFPAYFGNNWDAFIDCLGDLGWLGQTRVSVIHSALPRLDPESLRTYLECLRDAWQRHMAQQEPRLRLVFAAHLRADIEKIFALLK